VVSRKQQVEAIDVARVRDANCADERLSNAKRVAGNHLGFCRIKPEDSCIPWERAGPDEYCDLLEMCFWIHGDECVAQFDGASEIAALSQKRSRLCMGRREKKFASGERTVVDSRYSRHLLQTTSDCIETYPLDD